MFRNTILHLNGTEGNYIVAILDKTSKTAQTPIQIYLLSHFIKEDPQKCHLFIIKGKFVTVYFNEDITCFQE